MYVARPDAVTEWKMDARRPVERHRGMHPVGRQSVQLVR